MRKRHCVVNIHRLGQTATVHVESFYISHCIFRFHLLAELQRAVSKQRRLGCVFAAEATAKNTIIPLIYTRRVSPLVYSHPKFKLNNLETFMLLDIVFYVIIENYPVNPYRLSRLRMKRLSL